MRSSPFQQVELTEKQSAMFQAAILALSLIYDGEILAIVGSDDVGTFIHAQPKREVAVMKYLGGIDWKRAQMLAAEHSR